MDAKTLAHALRLSVADGALATIMGTLTGGLFLTGLAVALGASPLQFGVLAAIPPLANVAQIAGSFLIERSGRRKGICVWSSGIGRSLWLAMAVVPFLATYVSSGSLVWLLAVLLAGSSALGAIGGVAWLSWTRDLAPENIRVEFLSHRNQVTTTLALAVSLVSGFFLDVKSLNGFILIIFVAIAAGAGSLVLLAITPEPQAAKPEARLPFRRLLALPLRAGNFRRVVLFYASWNLAVNLAVPFFGVFMLKKMQLPFWQVNLLATLSSVMGLAANRFWTQLSKKFGARPIVFLATLGDAFVPLAWVFVTPAWAWLLIGIHLSGVFNAPIALGPNNLLLKLAPQQGASSYMAVFNAIVGVTTALAMVAGGVCASFLSDVHWTLGPTAFDGLKLIFLASFIGRLSSLLLLHGVYEPQAASVSHVFEVLRRAVVLQPRLFSRFVTARPELLIEEMTEESPRHIPFPAAKARTDTLTAAPLPAKPRSRAA